MEKLFKLLGIEADDETDELCNSIQKVSWRRETTGSDGDDGSYDRNNYEPDALQKMLEEIADYNECSLEEVTDEMFDEFVQVDFDTVTELATFKYDHATGKSTYYYDDIPKLLKRNKNRNFKQAIKDELPLGGFLDMSYDEWVSSILED